MRHTFCFIMLMILTSILSGCGDGGLMNISKLPVSDEVITGIAGDIKDSSVQKEAIYFDAVKSRDRLQKDMYVKSGFSVKFKMVEVSPGVSIQVMEDVSFRETPRFEQPLPSGPSEHPVWKTASSVVNKAADVFLWWTGITAMADFGKNAVNKAAPVNTNSFNQTAEPYVVQPEVIFATPLP